MDSFKNVLFKRKLLVSVVASLSVLCGFLTFYIIEEKKRDDLVATSWHCETIKTGFLSDALSRYDAFFEKMTLTFSSRRHISMKEFVEVTDDHGDVTKLENLYVGKYALKGNRLIVTIEDVKQHLPHPDKVINREYLEYKGVEIRYAISVQDDNLFMYSDRRSEIYNWTCFSSS